MTTAHFLRTIVVPALATAVLTAPLALGLSGTASAAESIVPIGPGYSDNHAGVECVQKALGVKVGSTSYGTFGTATYRAVAAFQQDQAITPVTGAVGPKTGDRLVQLGKLGAGCAAHIPTSGATAGPSDPSTQPDPPSDATTAPAQGSSATTTDRGATGGTAGTAASDAGSAAGRATGAPVPGCVEGSRASALAVARATTVTDPVSVHSGDEYDPVTIKLRYSEAGRCVWGWAGGPAGAQVWLERVRPIGDGNRTTDLELSPRAIQEGNGNTYGAAYPLTPGVTYRACGQVRQSPVCTDWFPTTTSSSPDAGTTTKKKGTTGSGSTGSRPAGGGNSGGTSTADTDGEDQTSPQAGSEQSRVVALARRILNSGFPSGKSSGKPVPYVWGGGHGARPGPSTGTCAGYTGSITPCPAEDTVGVDCSGFTRWVYAQAYGRDVLGAGNTDAQLRKLDKVSVSERRPGDLVFYNSKNGTEVGTTHVAIYIGNGNIINAPETGRNIEQEKVDAHHKIVGYYRVAE